MTRYRQSLRLMGLVVFLAGLLFATACDNGSPTEPTAAYLRKAVVSNFTITGNGQLASIGDTSQLKATMKTPQAVGDVTDEVTWTSVNPNVATVSATGLVTAVAVGTTTVKASFDGDEASIRIDVLEIIGVQIAGLQTFTNLGATAQLTLTATFVGGVTRQVAAQATWSSDNPAVASVTPTGLVRTNTFGTATISATYQTKSHSVTVNVTPLVIGVSVSGNLMLTNVGQTSQLTAIARYADGSTKDVTAEATWNSQNVNVASISNVGVVTAVAFGRTFISTSFQNRSTSSAVQVSPPGTFVVSGRVRDPGEGQGVGLGVPGFSVRAVTGGLATTTDASGQYSLAGVFPGDRVIYEKAGWEPIERIFNSINDDGSPGAQRVVNIVAGSSVAITTAPNDVRYQLQPGGTCTPCRIVRVHSSTGGTLELKLTWTGSGPRLHLWVAGQTFSSVGIAPIQTVANISVSAGENVVYMGLIGGQAFETNYMTLTLTTSISPPPGIISPPARNDRRKR